MAGLAAPAIEPYTLRVFGETGSYLIAWVIAFVVFMIAITIIATALTKILEVISLGFMNRLFGGLFGLIKYILVIVCSCIFWVMLKMILTYREKRKENPLNAIGS